MDYFLSKIFKLLKSKSKTILLGLAFILFSFYQNAEAQTAEEGKTHFAVCAACHTIGQGKIIGPDLKGINEKREEAWLIKFIQNSQALIQSGDKDAIEVFEAYNIPMPPNNLTDDQVRSLLEYIRVEGGGAKIETETETETAQEPEDEAQEPEVTKESEVIQEEVAELTEETPTGYQLPEAIEKRKNNFATFWIFLILFLIFLFDLIVTKFIKAKFIHIAVILISVIVIVEIVVIESIGLGRQEGYSPDQPIAFSHKVHVNQNKIDCKYCHNTVDDSRHAGIPSPTLCMNCHNIVKEGTTTGTGEIAKIYDAINKEKSIEWIKVHNLPEHVFFSHAQHVKIGEVDCAECHGDVENMDRIAQVKDLSMGWCINCHRDQKVTQFETNNFYDHYVELKENVKSGKINMVTVADIGGNDCQKCHY